MLAGFVMAGVMFIFIGGFCWAYITDAEDNDLRNAIFRGLYAGYEDHIEYLGPLTDEEIVGDMIAYDDDVCCLTYNKPRRYKLAIKLVGEWRALCGYPSPLPETIDKYR